LWRRPIRVPSLFQDRACEVAPFGKHTERAFFGVFDGHGQHGHIVSQYVATTLPKFVARARDLETAPAAALSAAFVACNSELATGGRVDCTFSGTTAVTVYLDGNQVRFMDTQAAVKIDCMRTVFA